MSHSTAFPIDQELAAAFSAEQKQERPTKSAFHVQIADEALVLKGYEAFSDDQGRVFTQLQQIAQAGEPSYFLLRDTQPENKTTSKWVLIMWIPEDAKVKDKMLYAATRDTIKKGLGHSLFTSDYPCAEKDELTWDVFSKRDSQEAALTQTEQLEQEDRRLERDSSSMTQSKSRLMFPMQQAALDAIESFVGNKLNFVQLRVDTEAEQITLSDQGTIGAAALADKFDPMRPTYNLFGWAHTSPTGTSAKQPLFYLSCPAEAGVKEKMLSATVKPSIAQFLELQGLTDLKQFDTDNDADDVSEASLHIQVYGAAEIVEEIPKSARPTPRRGGKGGRRMIGQRSKKLEDDD